MDILGRKVPQSNMQSYQLLKATISEAIKQAPSELEKYGQELTKAIQLMDETTQTLLGKMAQDPDSGLANATIYLDFMGRIILGWQWLMMATTAQEALNKTNCSEDNDNFYRGKIQAMKYHFEWELPEISHQSDLLKNFNLVCKDTHEDWF